MKCSSALTRWFEFFLVILIFPLGGALTYGACGDACLDSSDCSGSCPICVVGFCVDCGAMATESMCLDLSSGAFSNCNWNSASCLTNGTGLNMGTGGFGSTGSMRLNLNAQIEEPTAGTYYSNGQLVLAGYYFNGSNADFLSIRLYPDGTLDTSWGSGGQTITDVAGYDDRVHAVAIDSFGRVVMTGRVEVSTSVFDFGVVRYLSTGQLDTKFNTTGKVTTDFGQSESDFAWGLALNSLGHVLVAGYRDKTAGAGVNLDFAVARYMSNGALDTKFGSAGKVTSEIISGQHDTGHSVLYQTDNKAIVIGRSNAGSSADFAVARYATNGDFDTTFGSSGKVTTDFASLEDWAWEGAFDGLGRLVVVGRSHSGSNFDVGLVRYQADGTLDSDFESAGKNTKAASTTFDDIARGVAVFASDRILTVGRVGNGSNLDLFVMRLQTDGAFDTKYDTDGLYTNDLSGRDDEINGLAWDGKYYFAAIGATHNGSNLDFGIARIAGNAGLAKSGDRNTFLWGSDNASTGALAFDFSSGVVDIGYDLDFQTDGKIVGVSTWGSTGDKFAIFKMTPQGTLDTSFGSLDLTPPNTGVAAHAGTAPYDPSYAIFSASGNQLVSVGGGVSGSVVRRATSDGGWDTSYLGGAAGAYFASVYRYTKLVYDKSAEYTYAIGLNYELRPSRVTVSRHRSDGYLDTSFGTSGVASYGSGPYLGSPDVYEGFLWASQGSVVACGVHSCGGFVIRFTPTGTVDTIFASNGMIDVDGQAVYNCSADSKRRLIVVGQAKNNCAVWRYYTNGTLDTTFASAGEAQIDWASGIDKCSGRITQSGKIVVGGRSSTPMVYRYTRLLSNGALDAPFHSNPATDVDTLFGSQEEMRRVILSNTDMMWMIGETYNSSNDVAIQAVMP